MKEIKNCPFCGGEGELQDAGDWGAFWIQCQSCGAEGAYVDTNKDDAIDKWNNRVNNNTNKICEIINDQFSWILKVDEQTIYFQGGYNADYFEKHYRDLGYKIVKR